MSKRILIIGGVVLLFGAGIMIFLLRTHDEEALPVLTEKDFIEATAKMGWTNAPLTVVPAPLDLSKPLRLAIGSLGLADESRNEQLADLATADLIATPGFQP